jgi:integrase
MKADDVERLLQGIAQCPPKDRRDYAILVLLARLGLHPGEVATLTLDDLDWEAGTLTVRGKHGCPDRLPLPHAVGAALVLRFTNNSRVG